jgi:hypothetical protein
MLSKYIHQNFSLLQCSQMSTQKRQFKNLKYSLSFISLIAPGTISNLSTLFLQVNSKRNKKLFLKQSYLLLTWFSYLTSAKKGGGDGQLTRISPSAQPKIAMKPSKKTIFTLTKAPMAHKTFSQEQFLFKFYRFSVQFSIPTTAITGLNQSIYILLHLRQVLPIIETNILFLKRFNLKLIGSDTSFMQCAIKFYR